MSTQLTERSDYKLSARIPAYAEASAGRYPAERWESVKDNFPTSSAKRDFINIYKLTKNLITLRTYHGKL